MDVTGLALRAAAARPRVLLAALPGGTAARLEAGRLLRLRDWPSAATPAQADLLLVVGPDCPRLHGALDRLWRDLPAPRARVHAADAGAVGARLDEGRALLRSSAGQREQAGTAAAAARDADRKQPETSAGADGSGDEEDPGSRHPHGGGHHGGHSGGGMDMDMGMEMPGGLPMAEQGEDRDGLTLDRLHVPLGPFLADWPAGLTIRVTLQGDVVQEAELREAAPPGHAGGAFWVQPWLRAAAGEPVTAGEAARRRAAAHLDSLARLLAVAGWPAEAVAARRLRDDLLDGAPGTAVALRLDRFARRVGRSRALAWLTRGIGRLSTAQARQAGVSGPAARAGGDVADRYRQWLADIRRDLGRLAEGSPLAPAADEGPRGYWRDDRPPSAALMKVLPELLTGAELAAARLIVASLDPDLDELAAARREAGAHG
ncbi:hypothetical protein [Streptomyces sp. NBC_01198]|uniref:hypothetical protein n=1 Tax=Streptomyces sp. NBC_01198 TaxID=2903769 RepID=UPI002E109446|nr:hypothetical protein OG702_04995 [Streptomyces sp. NBC_01198]